MANRTRRIYKEMDDLKKDQLSGMSAETIGDDVSHLQGKLKGPPNTPYEGGTFLIDIKIPQEYPFKPPVMKFETRVYHPNVSSQTGAICLDTLANAWSPVLTIKSALLSLQSLLASPEPKDPQDAEVAGVMLRDPAVFDRTAREWAVRYAGAPSAPASSSSNVSLRNREEEARRKAEEERRKLQQAEGYQDHHLGPFLAMGFDIPRVVRALKSSGIPNSAPRLSSEASEEVVERLLTMGN
ncbi:hypothetical protein AA313_de0207371 [Arthrobotrys entomopaga]|nr:hypothetical protein AA313_de0207371 [Arthrobotrys entomopaga]